MVHYGRNPVIVVIANGIYGYEQFLVDASFFSSLTQPPRPYVVLNQSGLREICEWARRAICPDRRYRRGFRCSACRREGG